MKICPACNAKYSDDTLLYCFDDGTPLVGPSGADMPTVVLGEIETAVGKRNTGWHQTEVTRIGDRPQRSGSNTLAAIALTALGMLILFGIAAWLYLGSRQSEVGVNAANTSNNENRRLNSPAPSPQMSQVQARIPAAPANNAPETGIDDPQIRSEVSQAINGWKSQAEALDLNSYMSHYARTVDYYRKPGASADFVRSDKQRAFSRYSSIDVNLSNMSVTTDSSGQTATAIFDKEWDFQGNGSSSGKVQQLMRLRKIGGQWLITAEKDLNLYYKR